MPPLPPLSMPLTRDKDLRRYYSVGEVSARLGLTASLLRYWEREFPSLHPRRAGRGVRLYTEEDIREIELIRDLLRSRGMKIAAAREALACDRGKAERRKTLRERLLALRAELLALRRELDEPPP